MKKTFNTLTRREQQLVVLGVALASIFLLFFINSSLQDKKEKSFLSYNQNQKLFLDVQKSLSLKSQYQSENKTDSINLSSTVSSLARSFNLTIDKIQPTEEGEIIISINQTEFVGLYEWLRELELKKGIVVSKASVRINTSRGSVSGVRAQLVLKILYMKIRFTILIFVLFFLLLVLSFPMRGLVSLLDDKNQISTTSIEGFWWKSQLNEIVIDGRLIGNIDLNFSPFSLFKGKFQFDISLSGPELNFNGILGLTFLREIFIQDLALTANPQIKIQSGKPISQNISNIEAYIAYLSFNTKGCVRAKGEGTGQIIDMFGLFSRNLDIAINMKCTKDQLELVFESIPSGVLEGEVLINSDFEYVLEARSQRLSNKIKEISQLNFQKEPSLKISGRLNQLLNSF